MGLINEFVVKEQLLKQIEIAFDKNVITNDDKNIFMQDVENIINKLLLNQKV